MSERWPGGIVRSTPVTPTGPLQNGTAPGIWTMEQAAYWTKQGLWPTAGNFTAVEDVFSTYLYTGNGTSQTITNGINLSGQGGLVWTKRRVNTTYGDTYHILTDTIRGANKQLYSNGTDAQATNSNMITSFNADGYSIGSDGNVNFSGSGQTYASWTFREAPNFFDVVTYTGNGVARMLNHNLGVAPGMIIYKRTNSANNWCVYHRSVSPTSALFLNLNFGQGASPDYFGSQTATATQFPVGTNDLTNSNGDTYVAYLFAHDTSSTGLVQCGSFATPSSGNADINLGWEPQWVLIKRSDTGTEQDWFLADNMRGMTAGGASTVYLSPNQSTGDSNSAGIGPTATGFTVSAATFGGSRNFIYMAIRRGPMRTPTLGTSVYDSVAYSGNNTAQRVIGSTTLTDMIWLSDRTANSPGWSANYAHYTFDRLRGDDVSLATSKTSGQISGWAPYIDFDLNVGWDTGSTTDQGYLNGTGSNYLSRSFKRAPGFFDEICYNGTGTNGQTYNHNLGVVPELVIFKRRNSTGEWPVWHTSFGTGQSFFYLNSAQAVGDQGIALMSALPSATQITLTGPASWWNFSGSTYVAYLFASCPGVSKVGSYTGNGTSQTINCGFSSTARFILIKRADSTGDWYTWDAATGLVAGNDPHLSLNTAAAEVTTDDSVDTNSTGFIVNQDAATNINVNGATYIFLAVA